MIETSHTLLIDAPIARAWDYVQDMRRWASLLPGCKECVVEDAAHSRWVLKVGAAGLVRTVNVLVHVDNWAGPERVEFSYKLAGDPVEGSGAYIAAETGDGQTEMTMQLSVKGSGPLAPMWEAISKPLLPHIAKSFATKLKQEIEATAEPNLAAGNASADAQKTKTFSQKLRNILPSRAREE